MSNGKRFAPAAQVAAKAGFSQVFNVLHVLEGFAGEIDAGRHRGGRDGWRYQ